jgi:hypothetical protein
MQQSKHCTQCRYHKPHDFDDPVPTAQSDIGYCAAPAIARVAAVTYPGVGDAAGAMMAVGHVRMFGCGEEGKWWEIKDAAE